MCSRGGLAPIVVILAVLAFLGAGTYFTVTKKEFKKPIVQNPAESKTQKVLPETPEMKTSEEKIQPRSYNQPKPQSVGLFGQQCDGSGTFKIKTFPIDPKNIELIMPMGRVQDSHVTPTDHQYIIPVGTKGGSFVTDNPKKYEVKAPADGYIITIELFKEPVEEQYRSQEYANNYLVLFEHSCDFYTRLIHIDTLSSKVAASFSFKNPESQHPYAQARIPVKEGEVIGTVGSHSFDFQIMDAKFKAPNLINPKNIDFFSSNTVDTFKYTEEPLSSALLAKNLTKKEPLGGKIDYDVYGKLMGNWFLVGRGSARENYWTNNLSIVYDHLDPTQIRVSLGNFDNYPKAFGVVNNAPDPSQVGVEYGIVKYELSTFDYFSNDSKWDPLRYAENLVAKNTNEIRGIVLFQLLDEKTLKVETFPNKNASQVSGFTENSVLYER